MATVKIRTKNSVYAVKKENNFVEMTRVKNHYPNGDHSNVALGDEITGKLVREIKVGEPIFLTNGWHSSEVLAIEK